MKLALASILGFAVFLIASASAQQAIPENDSFATRIRLFGTNLTATGNNTGATREIGEPDLNFTGGRSVWWTWTAPKDGGLTLTTAGSTFDTMVTVFTGDSLTNLQWVSFNDNETNTSQVAFNVVAGTEYQIAVDGTDGTNSTGGISLLLMLGPVQPPPANDDFVNATLLVGSQLNNVPGSNAGATRESLEPFHADTLGGKSVWWTWTAPFSGGLTLTSQGSLIDTVVAIYTGNSISNLQLFAGNDEDPLSPFGYESRITCNVISNVTYHIAVDGYEGDAGDIRLRLRLDAPFPVPTNDHFTSSLTISGNNVTTTGSNVGATFEPGEPTHLFTFGGKSVWWKWTAPTSGSVMLTTTNSAVDTLLAVYRGTALSNLTFVAGNDEATEIEHTSLVYFNATANTTYYFAVDGYDGDSGAISLRLATDLADPVPSNNNFANRIAINGTNTIVNGSNIGATLEAGEPLHRGYYGGSSVWWRWTSPNAGYVTIDTSNSVPDTLLAVYTGSSLAGLTEIASDDNSGGGYYSSLVRFHTKSNVTYAIAVDGYDGDAGNIKLRVRFGQASYTLTTAANLPGAGSVSVSPVPDQGGKYAPGSVVAVTATPAGGNFTGWTGSVTSTNNPVLLTMNSNKVITANFSVSPTTKVWSGGSAGRGDWSIAANWSTGVPVPGDELIFPGGASRLASNTNDFPAQAVFKSISFAGNGYILRGNPLSLNQGILATNISGSNTLDLNVQLNSNQTFRCSTGSALMISGNVDLQNRTLTVAAAGPVTLSGVISGSGGLVKTNGGTLSLIGGNANTYTGATAIHEGTLQLGKNGIAVPGPVIIGDGIGGADADVVRLGAPQQISVNSDVAIGSSGWLDLKSFSDGIASLSGEGHIEIGATATLSVGYDNSSTSFGGTISGAGGLSKVGTGTLILSANNTYLGQTSVNDGRLIVNGSQPGSAVALNPPGVLGGSGTVGSLAAGGTVSPGSSPGRLTSGNVTLTSNTTFRVELDGLGAGSGYDQLKVNGTVQLAGTLDVTLGFPSAVQDTFTIVDNDGNDRVTGFFSGLPDRSFLLIGGKLFQISYSAGPRSNHVTLTHWPVTTFSMSPPSILVNGAIQLQGVGLFGLAYVLEAAPGLDPLTLWLPIRTNLADADGRFRFIDDEAHLFPMRFYRTRGPL